MKDYRFSNNTAKRRYELDLEDGQIAMIEYYLAPGGEVALTHTEVPYDHAGQGVGSQIAFKALTDIREQGSKVIPQCGFVASYIRRHPECRSSSRCANAPTDARRAGPAAETLRRYTEGFSCPDADSGHVPFQCSTIFNKFARNKPDTNARKQDKGEPEDKTRQPEIPRPIQ